MSLKNSLVAAASAVCMLNACAHVTQKAPSLTPAPDQQAAKQSVPLTYYFLGESCQPITNAFDGGIVVALPASALESPTAVGLVSLMTVVVQNQKIVGSKLTPTGEEIIDPVDVPGLASEAQIRGNNDCAMRARVRLQNLGPRLQRV
jgi:hypothetical protein